MNHIHDLERLEAAATKGPWVEGNFLGEIEAFTLGPTGRRRSVREVVGVGDQSGYGAGVVNDTDRAFIVSTRNALPAILHALRAAERVCEAHSEAEKRGDVDTIGESEMRYLREVVPLIRSLREALGAIK